MVDLEKPMHFTKEQSEWIKQYVIVKKQEARAEAIDAISKEIDRLNFEGGGIDDLQFFLEQLKEQSNEQNN